MKLLLYVGTGGFLGSVARYAISRWMNQQILSSIPWGTMTVNIAGCFIIGLIYALAFKSDLAPEWRLLIATGFCGGFTTFSSFSYENIALLQDGQFGAALFYIGGSLLLGLAATVAGIALIRAL